MKLTTILVFGAGYVFGTKAGRDQYERFAQLTEQAAARLESYGSGKGWRIGRDPDGKGWRVDRDPGSSGNAI